MEWLEHDWKRWNDRGLIERSQNMQVITPISRGEFPDRSREGMMSTLNGLGSIRHRVVSKVRFVELRWSGLRQSNPGFVESLEFILSRLAEFRL